VASAAPKPGLARQAQPDPAPPATPSAAAPAERKEGTRRITMKFERESWVEIRGRDGKTLLSKLNAAGAEETVEGRPPFALIIGNAQHVRLSYDDQPIDLAPHVKVEVARFTLD
jgi:cytoskeleton protein RodZ